MTYLDECHILTRKRVDFGALAEVLARGVGCYSFRPALDDQEVFEVYRWMAASVTGKNSDRWSWPTRWVRESLACNLGGRPNCGGCQVEPILETIDTRHQDYRRGGWREEMAQRFAHALFDKGPMAEWRKAMGIDVSKPRSIGMLVYDRVPPPPRSTHYGFDGEVLGWLDRPQRGRRSGFDGEIDRLFRLASRTRTLIPRFNTEHDGPMYVTAVMLTPTPSGWVASVEYGFQGSRWSEDYRWIEADGQSEPRGERDPLRCFQRKDEPFANFIYRAHDKFDALLTPPCASKLPTCPSVRRDGFHGAQPHGLRGWALSQRYGGAMCEVGP